MISKQDILERSREWQLRPDVVEKDYVLGWLLAAIALNQDTAASWILKGGTCVKKCFFETYRFSEDLDFTLLPEAAYTEDELKSTRRDITDVAHELSGIEFSPEALSVRERKDGLGRTTFEGKIGYKGPLAVPGWPRVLFDLTQHEPVVDEPVLRAILHPYPDGPLPENSLVSTYSIEELIAEKTRALFERTRPRDLYDVVYILTNSGSLIELGHAREVFGEKCVSKRIVVPDLQQMLSLVTGDQELAGEWSNMLSHQLPTLPPIESILARLMDALAWLAPIEIGINESSATRLPRVAGGANEQILSPASSRLWGTAVPLEAIRFAGANSLLIEFLYNGKRRTIEPYSLRRSSKGNLLLYAWELETGQIKCFDVGKIGSLRTTTRAFSPRYSVEFTASGAINTWTPVSLSASGRTFRRTSRRQHHGPIYVFRCPVCDKEFRHTRNDSTLRRHKMPDSPIYCSSRRGFLDRMA